MSICDKPGCSCRTTRVLKPRNPVAQLVTPLSDMDAYAIAEDAMMYGSPNGLPPILVRARVKDALLRVGQASRDQSGARELLDALKALGATSEGYCFCRSKEQVAGGHTERCRAAVAAIYKVDPEAEPIEAVDARLKASVEGYVNSPSDRYRIAG